MVSADVNNGASGSSTGAGTGTPEIWTSSGGALTAYTVSDGTITTEGTGSAQNYPGDDWPVTDGYASLQNGTAGPATIAETITGNNAGVAGTGYAWERDSQFAADLGLDGSTTLLTPSASTIPTTDELPYLSLWFQSTSANSGILASLQSSAVVSGPATVANYDPVMYVGTDGHLHAEWYNGVTAPLISQNQVDTGLWYHAVLTTNEYGTEGISYFTQTLYLNGQLQGSVTDPIDLADTTSGNNTNLTFGDGYIGGLWPDEPHYNSSGGSGYPGYFFNGEIADITFFKNSVYSP